MNNIHTDVTNRIIEQCKIKINQIICYKFNVCYIYDIIDNNLWKVSWDQVENKITGDVVIQIKNKIEKQ